MKYRQKEKVVKNAYPSNYGSHTSMIEEGYTEFNSTEHEFVVCKDYRGLYVTTTDMLDTGLCDYNRSVNKEARDQQFEELVTNK